MQTQRPPSSELAGAIVKFALLDLAGMLLLALGVGFLVQGPGAFFDAFPGTLPEAVALTTAGVAVMAYAAVGVLRAVARLRDQAAE